MSIYCSGSQPPLTHQNEAMHTWDAFSLVTDVSEL